MPGYLVVKPLKEETIGDIPVADTMNDKDSAGVVVAVGASFMFYEGNQAIEVKSPVGLGQKIIYNNIGTNIYLSFETGERLRLVRFHCDPYWGQVLGIINN